MAMAETKDAKPALITPNGGVRCWSCGRRWANLVTPPYDFTCRCGAKNIETPYTP